MDDLGPPTETKTKKTTIALTLPEENQATEQAIEMATAAVGATEMPKVTQKAKKVELAYDRMRAASGKGYRVVKATRGVV